MSLDSDHSQQPTGESLGPNDIPFNRPSLEGREMTHMQQAVAGGHASADGPFTARAVELLREATGAADILLTTSCTAALEMSAMMLDIEPGDTVVVPSFGFVTTALAFVRQGARILFCDIDETRLGLDPAHLATLMNNSVRAVVPIHYGGVACDLAGILTVLADWPRAELVEDNAHGLFGRYRGQPLGTFGRFAALSFHETKNFSCGEGGALIINHEADIPRAHTLYHKGTNRRAFALGEVSKYSWQDIGSSFGLSDILAAYLVGQLEQQDSIRTRRRQVFEYYRELLEPVAADLGLELPCAPSDCEQAHHLFHVLLPDPAVRGDVLASMRRDGVYATFHYVPLHTSPGGRRFAARETECPVTEDVSARLLRLPFYNNLATHDAERAVTALLDTLKRRT